MKQLAIICDLDGTLFKVTERINYPDEGKWDEFHEAGCREEANPWCAEILDRFYESHMILFVTGRPETYKDETEEQIAFECDIPQARYELLMAPPMTKDVLYKEQVYKEYIQENFDVLFVLDDRPRVVDMWRRLGLTCLQPNFLDH